jgi:hypothetical protein
MIIIVRERSHLLYGIAPSSDAPCLLARYLAGLHRSVMRQPSIDRDTLLTDTARCGAPHAIARLGQRMRRQVAANSAIMDET